MALHLGSALHEVLDWHAKQSLENSGDGTNLDVVGYLNEWMDKEAGDLREEYKKKVGVTWSEDEEVKLREGKQLCLTLVQNYFDRWGMDNPIKPYKYIATEITFRIPIPNTDGPCSLCGMTGTIEVVEPDQHDAEVRAVAQPCPDCSGTGVGPGWLTGTFDGLATRDGTDELWIVDHKTYSQKPREDALTDDDQFTGYCWAAQALFGIPVSGFLYDGIAKKLPTVPRILKNGSVSCEWVDTSAEVFRRQVEANGKVVHENEKYLNHYRRLLERESQPQTPFHTRWKLFRSQHKIAMWEKSLIEQYHDMVSEDLKLYPNFRWEGCWDCDVKDLCRALEEGEDIEWLKDVRYMKSTGYTTSRRQVYTPTPVSSLNEIITVRPQVEATT